MPFALFLLGKVIDNCEKKRFVGYKNVTQIYFFLPIMNIVSKLFEAFWGI